MAIYGVGSRWDEGEVSEQFFKAGNFTLGWDENNAKDLYVFLASLKAGDILYLKANQPGSRNIRVKGIGLVKDSFISNIHGNLSDIRDFESFSIPVEWIVQEEFSIQIPENTGKLTNIRAATAYEEFLPFVQENILEKLIGNIIINKKRI